MHDGEGNGMKCPDCGGAIKFQKSDITCSVCSWTPSPTVLNMYRLAPLTNRRALFGALCVFVTAGGVVIFSNLLWLGMLLFICGAALVPVQFAVRSWTIKKMTDQFDGVEDFSAEKRS
jgi:hypothetical protein